jgi:alcohol dehydrogenase
MWSFHNPVRLSFGTGCFEGIGEALTGRSYALVTYPDPYFGELAERVAALNGAPCLFIDNVIPNPDFAELAGLCDRLGALSRPPEVLLALGGGSVIDTAKVLAASNGDFDLVRRHLVKGESSIASGILPIIAVPTTAGTGSEVTCWATVWDASTGVKYSLARDELYPELAIVDPLLMCCMPRSLTTSTALDALSHALESIWNVNANPISTNYAVTAAREILSYLPNLLDDLTDLELRTRIAKAALMAGLAFSNTKTALAHSLSYPITLRHGVPHGLACSFSLPMVLRGVLGADAECDAALQSIFGLDLEAGAENLSAFLRTIGAPACGTDLGIAQDEIRALLIDAFAGVRGRNFIGSRERVVAAQENLYHSVSTTVTA